MPDIREERMALISVLAGRAPNGYLGRTAVMKLLYFLQTLRGVPLDYRFSLHSYGPFDSDVLADLAAAESLGAVESTVTEYRGGYSYRISPGPIADWLQRRNEEFLGVYEEAVRWVLERFGPRSSADLELLSTIVFVDRESLTNGEDLTLRTLAEIVHDVKPHFTRDQIIGFASALRDEGLLEAAA